MAGDDWPSRWTGELVAAGRMTHGPLGALHDGRCSIQPICAIFPICAIYDDRLLEMSAQRARSAATSGSSPPMRRMDFESLPDDEPSDRFVTNRRMTQEGQQPEGAVTLSQGDVEAIAEATARKLAEFIGERGKTFGLVGPRELAEGLGVSLDYVYAHATELGAMRLGSGPKARIRFDLDRARQSLEARARNGQAKAVALVARAAARAGPDRLERCRSSRAKNHRNVVTRPEPDGGARCDDGVPRSGAGTDRPFRPPESRPRPRCSGSLQGTSSDASANTGQVSRSGGPMGRPSVTARACGRTGAARRSRSAPTSRGGTGPEPS